MNTATLCRAEDCAKRGSPIAATAKMTYDGSTWLGREIMD